MKLNSEHNALYQVVLETLKFDEESARCPSREQALTQKRQEAFYAIYTIGNEHGRRISYPLVGELFNRDHSTVIHGYNLIAKRMSGAFGARIESVLTSVRQRLEQPAPRCCHCGHEYPLGEDRL